MTLHIHTMDSLDNAKIETHSIDAVHLPTKAKGTSSSGIYIVGNTVSTSSLI